MSAFGYRAEIDGLRTIAVIPVILFHMGISWIPGGFIGVDVFFVISGFLITSILQKELEEGSFSLSNFWGRRVRRILPAMLFVTASTITFTHFFVFGPDQSVIGSQAIAALCSVANIYFWRSTGDYWGNASENSPFLHAWSLSVEEQFYLVFPVIVWVIYRYQKRWLSHFVALVSIGSFALFLWGSQTHPTATFYLLPTRAWELGAGALLAVLCRSQSSHNSWKGIFAAVGLGMIISSYLLFDSMSVGQVIAVAGAMLVIAFGNAGFCRVLISQRPMVHVGKLSYSLYLWHWPILVLAKDVGIDWPGVTDKLVLGFATYLFSFVTYVFVENTTRRRPKVVLPVLAIGVVVVLFAFALSAKPTQYDIGEFNRPAYYQNYYSLQPEGSAVFQSRFPGWYNPPRTGGKTAYREGGVVVGPKDGSPRIVVFGDSHGVMWSNAIRGVVERYGFKTAFYSAAGAPPVIHLPLRNSGKSLGFRTSDERFEYDKARHDYILKWKPDLVILCWAWSRARESDVVALVDFLETSVGFVLLMEQPPIVPDIDRRDALQFLIWQGVNPGERVRKYWPAGVLGREDVFKGNELIRRVAAGREKCDVIPVFDIYYKDGESLVVDGFDVVYLDFMHLSDYGARMSSDRVESAILDALERDSL